MRVHYTRISYTRVRVCKCIYESIFDIISCEVRDGRCAEREKKQITPLVINRSGAYMREQHVRVCVCPERPVRFVCPAIHKCVV